MTPGTGVFALVTGRGHDGYKLEMRDFCEILFSTAEHRSDNKVYSNDDQGSAYHHCILYISNLIHIRHIKKMYFNCIWIRKILILKTYLIVLFKEI